MTPAFRRALVDSATAPFRKVGRFTYYFARGKLRGDPIFFTLLEQGLVPDQARLLDLGCGQGVLPSWLLAARELYESGRWPPGWPPAPRLAAARGVELMRRDVARARKALDGRVAVELGDIRQVEFGTADVVAILDALHYMPYDDQEGVLRRVHEALVPGGRLVTRFGDAAAGLPFHLCNGMDHVVTFVRGHRLARLYCRPLAEWRGLLERVGFRLRTLPMSGHAPFANVMVIADRPKD